MGEAGIARDDQRAIRQVDGQRMRALRKPFTLLVQSTRLAGGDDVVDVARDVVLVGDQSHGQPVVDQRQVDGSLRRGSSHRPSVRWQSRVCPALTSKLLRSAGVGTMRTTPASAFAPNSVPCGPRSTSIRSMSTSRRFGLAPKKIDDARDSSRRNKWRRSPGRRRLRWQRYRGCESATGPDLRPGNSRRARCSR